MLWMLAASPERVYTYEQLLLRIWKDEDGMDERCVHSCVNRVRRKLESAPGCRAEIENVRGVGYRYQEKKE